MTKNEFQHVKGYDIFIMSKLSCIISNNVKVELHNS